MTAQSDRRQHARENDTKLYRSRIANHTLRLSAKKFDDLICNTINREYQIHFQIMTLTGNRSQRRQNIKRCQRTFLAHKLTEQQRLNQRNEKAHTKLQQQKDKCVFHASQ